MVTIILEYVVGAFVVANLVEGVPVGDIDCVITGTARGPVYVLGVAEPGTFEVTEEVDASMTF